MNNSYPKYSVKPFYSRDNPSNEPAGWDVWEETEKSEVVVVPCDTRERADEECRRLVLSGLKLDYYHALKHAKTLFHLGTDTTAADERVSEILTEIRAIDPTWDGR